MAALQRLWSQPPYTVDLAPGFAPDLVIAFASIGHDPTRAPSPEFVRTATAGNRPALFVSDAARSWATAPGFAETLTTALAALPPVQRILTLGSSLGAVMALRAAEILPVTAVLAIGPQSRPADPAELRWRTWTAALPPDLTTPLPANPWIILMHALLDDHAHALAFPERKGTDHLLFAGLAHSALAPHLKTQGVLQGLVDSALHGDRRRLLRIAASAGAQRRARR
jgi:hypothetical protein